MARISVPDFTADYLHRAALIAIDHYGGSSSEAAKQQTITDFKANRYDGSTGVLRYSAAQAEAFEKLDIVLRRLLWNAIRSSDCGPRPSPTLNRSDS